MSQSPVKREPGVKKENQSPQMLPAPRPAAGGDWNMIPLKACTQNDLQDTRNHIMKFQTKQDVDIMKNFTKPVRLHRKDPRNIQFQLTREEIDRRKKEGKERGVDLLQDPEEIVLDENGEPTATKMDMSQVAPDGGARKHRRNMFKRKTKQVHMMDEQKRKLRYEEYYPWVIEDYDGKNVFVGNYEGGLTDSTHVLFVFDKDGFKMVPAEKVYRFTPRNKYATLTLEEAEAKMEKNQSAPRWLMKHMDEGESSDRRFKRNGASNQFGSPVNPSARSASANSRMRTVQGGSSLNDRDSDHDELDFDEEFADDEEAPIMDGAEEDNKLSEKKMKKEMLKAAHLGGQLDVEDSDDEINDLFEVEKSRKVDKEGKKLKKVLHKTEGGVYDSDDNEIQNPYVSQSDLESEEESEPEVTVKQEPTDGLSDQAINRPRTMYVTSINDGFVVIRASKQFLQGFQPGEWNPHIRKRARSVESHSASKKQRREDSPTAKSASALPVPEAPGGTNLEDPGANGELVTTREVLDIVRKQPLATKELLLKLKHRISMHKDNKLRIISIVKTNLKLVDGQLRLKEE
ncbi:hypothetical protein C7M61_002694 [Candidozyma pseudohaemuli]|uniref:Transcription initiation factor IIF subunit alpha n=1 Tax=Candidozyma pseudohaemuli TaxID=418784 RepID=A0A2P7YS15_9ASCO|nr:hypothetical protein C7M61_002694 [[Candida] pseudohaemulonii]PSK38755.1 hypothetical protein C7M61_002694 [[Candida] pseudohaemulonii]